MFTFVYVQRDKVPYTVKYLDKATGEPVANEKHNETSSAIITENAVYVPNYVPERSSQRLVLSANESENVLIFYYVKDTVNTLVTVRYWQQNAEGGGYTMIEETTETVANGCPYTAEKKEYDGFAYERAAAEVNGSVEKEYTAAEDVTYTVPEDGLLVLNLYYVRQMYSYEFRFVDDLTGNSAAPSVTGSARFGSVVPQQYKNLEADGYVLADGQAENAQITITKENDKNVYTFHYMSFFNVVHVQNGTNGETKRVVMNSSHLELAPASPTWCPMATSTAALSRLTTRPPSTLLKASPASGLSPTAARPTISGRSVRTICTPSIIVSGSRLRAAMAKRP